MKSVYSLILEIVLTVIEQIDVQKLLTAEFFFLSSCIDMSLCLLRFDICCGQ